MLHPVKQAFHKLNLEGMISTPDNSNFGGFGPAGTTYHLQRNEDGSRKDWS